MTAAACRDIACAVEVHHNAILLNASQQEAACKALAITDGMATFFLQGTWVTCPRSVTHQCTEGPVVTFGAF